MGKTSKKKAVRESVDSGTNTEPALLKPLDKPKLENDLWPYTSTHRQEPFEISVEIKASSKKDKTM